MNTPSNTRVVFFQVKENSEKLKRIIETAHLHFEKRDLFLILVEDEKSEKFVDELLWKFPATSFLPHVTSNSFTQEFITITKIKKNVNHARVVFNLCTTPLFLDTPFRIIYEFEDLTAPNKKNLSSGRFDAYKKAGFLIEAR